MQYIISLSLILAFLTGFASFSSPVTAKVSVSGEVRISSTTKPKPITKTKLTSSQKQKFIEQRDKLLAEIAVVKERIAKYSASISDYKTKIEARKKAGIKDNVDLETKLKALKKALLQDKKNLATLMEKLAYVESKLK
jgi:uncharacterized protein YlxW (UPF0749 family)